MERQPIAKGYTINKSAKIEYFRLYAACETYILTYDDAGYSWQVKAENDQFRVPRCKNKKQKYWNTLQETRVDLLKFLTGV